MSTIPSRPVRSRPSSRSSRNARTTTSRTVPTASARSCCPIATTSSEPLWLSEARSRRWRATRRRMVAKAVGISAMNDSTRSLSSSSRARATRTSRSAARRTNDARNTSRSASVTAWIVAGSKKGDANSDTTPMRAAGRQYRTVIVRPSGAVTYTRTRPVTTISKCGDVVPSRWSIEPAGTCSRVASAVTAAIHTRQTGGQPPSGGADFRSDPESGVGAPARLSGRGRGRPGCRLGADRHFHDLTGINPRHLRRSASITLVQMTAGRSRQAAARQLGLPPARCRATSYRIQRWARDTSNSTRLHAALDALAGELDTASDLIDYRQRRDTLTAWSIPTDDWHELIADVKQRQRRHASAQTDWGERKRRVASVLVWARVTDGEYRLAPLLADQWPPSRRRELARRDAASVVLGPHRPP